MSLVTCLVLFCKVVAGGALGQCDSTRPVEIVELREVVTGVDRPWLSAEKAACRARFWELREMGPASDEWPVRFEVARPAPINQARSVEIAEGE